MQWQNYSDKFSSLSVREQTLVAITGLVAIVFILYFYVIEGTFSNVANINKHNSQLMNETRNLQNTIIELQAALRNDPNENLKRQIVQYQQKLAKIDQSLLVLTSKLVDPIQMRLALEQLLRMQKGVKLVSFEVSGAQPIVTHPHKTVADNSNVPKNNNLKVVNKNLGKKATDLGLYRHTIKLKLSGTYFQLRDYLTQLESLPWKFFWEKFDYQLTTYPKSELNIEIYSLSLKQEFIGV